MIIDAIKKKQFIPVLRLLKNLKTASLLSGNCPFLGTLNFFHDGSLLLNANSCFCHSQTLLSSAPKLQRLRGFPSPLCTEQIHI
jgi:hypothetical protein